MIIKDDKPVEELIGWAPIYYCGSPQIVGWYDTKKSERSRAEVDDLANWLTERGWPRYVVERHRSLGVFLWLYTLNGDAHADNSFESSTERDCLCAAVRVVHAENEA